MNNECIEVCMIYNLLVLVDCVFLLVDYYFLCYHIQVRKNIRLRCKISSMNEYDMLEVIVIHWSSKCKSWKSN